MTKKNTTDKKAAPAKKPAPARKRDSKVRNPKAAAAEANEATPAQTPTKKTSKTDTVLTLLKQPGGVTLAQLQEATGWQPHSVRGFLSGTVGKKMGLKLESMRGEHGVRAYTLEAK